MNMNSFILCPRHLHRVGQCLLSHTRTQLTTPFTLGQSQRGHNPRICSSRPSEAAQRHFCSHPKPPIAESQHERFNEGENEEDNVQNLLNNAVTSDNASAHSEDSNNSSSTQFYEEKYKNYRQWKRDQSKHAYRPNVDPKDTSIVLFPGQGAQFVGMGRDLLGYRAAEDLYSVASDILGYDLLKLCLEGPQEELDKTIHCQPAVLVTSLAAVEKLKSLNSTAIEHCISTAGFSVGEYAALVFSGALTFTDAVEVVKARAEAMQAASEATPSGMLTVFLSHKSKLNFAMHTARLFCEERLDIQHPVCAVANFLYPECKVVAGNTEALEFIEQNCKDFGIPRTKRVPVSGAFHTTLMRPARKALENALERVRIHSPVVPVHSNVTSFKYGSRKNIRGLLLDQLTRPVKWEQTLHVLYSRPGGEPFPSTYEVGPGNQLGALLKRVNVKAHEGYEGIVV